MFGVNLRRSSLAIMTIAAIGMCAAPGVRADTAPDDPYLAVLNATINPASPAFVNTVKANLTIVPPAVKTQMKDAGEHIGVGKHISDVFPGFPDSSPGGFNSMTGTVGFGEYITVNGIDAHQDPEPPMKHEMGHGLDYAARVAQGSAYCTSAGFTAAYSKDLSEMPPDVQTQLAYYIQGGTPENPSGSGRAEAFAEIFRIRYGANADTGDNLIRQYFDDTVAWENALLPPRLLDAVTGTATDVTESAATLHGSVNPHGMATSYRFEFGTGSAYGSSTPLYEAGSGTGDVPVAAGLSGLAPGMTYHYRIVALRWGVPLLHGADAQFTTAPSVVVARPPVNVSPPVIVGSATPGVTLTCAPGQWTGAESFAYEWLRDGARQSSGSSYLITASDVGHGLACRVTANRDGSASASSAPLTVRASAPGGTSPGGTSPGGTSPGGGTTPTITAPPPRMTELTLTPARFKAARSGPSALARGASGALVTFRLDNPATVTFIIERSWPGRLVKGSCTAQTRANRAAKRCTRWSPLKGSFTWAAKAGVSSLRFTGRLAGRKLAPGIYRLIALPRARSGAAGQPSRATFTIGP